MVISFHPVFVERILCIGEWRNEHPKIHTIRLDPHNRWKAGMKMHMATGVRTKKYKQFAEKVCTGTQTFELRWITKRTKDAPALYAAYIDGKLIEDVWELATNDGFDTDQQLLHWFGFGKDFKGKIIHWTDFRY